MEALVAAGLGNASLPAEAGGHAGLHPGGKNAEFNREYYTLLFIVALWSSGKIFARLGMPALLGEIVVGVILGPEVINLAPEPHALELYGELGLTLLMIEAGLHVDVEMLQIVGLRALAVGLLGSILPMLAGFPIAIWGLGCNALEAFAVSATLATMSTGIALNVLKAGGVLNQPTGQLIIAAATVNEMVNISLLTELGAIASNGSWFTYVVPLVIMYTLVAFFGVAAIKVVPCLVDRVVLPRVRRSQRENVVLGLTFAVALLLMPLCKYTGSSELLGAFLAGFCFCTDQNVHHTWERQVKRVAAFLMRLFFASSIAFSIPIVELSHPQVLRDAALLFTTIVTKLGMGLFARPAGFGQFCLLGFAWGAWGEFSFIMAVQAQAAGIIDRSRYNAIVLTVLLSVVLCPLALRRTLARLAAAAGREIDDAKKDTGASEIGNVHNVYYCLQTRSNAHWGQQEALLSAIFGVGCKIIDFRTFHPIHHVGAAHVVNELYLKDLQLKLELHEELDACAQAQLDARIGDILDEVARALNAPDAELKMSRWLPGEGTPELILSLRRGSSPRASQDVESPALLDRRAAQAAFRHLEEASRRHVTFMSEALENYTSQPNHFEAHHELDGFVHTDAHDAFNNVDAITSERRSSSSSEDDSEEEGSAPCSSGNGCGGSRRRRHTQSSCSSSLHSEEDLEGDSHV